MPLRTAAKLCPQAIFVDGHPERYRDYSAKVYEVLNRFSPKLEMVSIDEAYVDMTGTERLYGPPMRAAHALHEAMKSDHQLELLDWHRSVAPDRQSLFRPGQAQRRAVIVLAGGEVAFLAPLDVRKIPGVGKVMEKRLQDRGIHKVGDLAGTTSAGCRANFGALGLRWRASRAAWMQVAGLTGTLA